VAGTLFASIFIRRLYRNPAPHPSRHVIARISPHLSLQFRSFE
jgi:hypothetical protein